MSIVFDKEESAYLHWRQEHPEGRIVNCRRHQIEVDAVLHRSNCKSIGPLSDSKDGEFTERGYLKICAQSESDARDTLRLFLRKGQADFSKRCGLCKP